MPKYCVRYVETVYYSVDDIEADSKKTAKEKAEAIINDMTTEEFRDLFMGGESDIQEVYAEEMEE
jgi:hypothetical protein